MNRREAKQLLPIITAFAEGKTIEVLEGSTWRALTETSFPFPPKFYRVKPEPAYRPFKSAAEFDPHAGKYVRGKHEPNSSRTIVRYYNDSRIDLAISTCTVTWSSLFDNYVFVDGTPCGVLVGDE
jgi:hypothetical protein